MGGRKPWQCKLAHVFIEPAALIRSLIPQEGSSRVIDLNGELRHLSKIEFWYEKAGFVKGKGCCVGKKLITNDKVFIKGYINFCR